MYKAVFPGTFDPITLGHVDLVRRALCLVDKLLIAVYQNPKVCTLFDIQAREELVRGAVADFGEKVEVIAFQGLLVDLARRQNIRLSVRGARSLADFEYEFRMSQVNAQLHDSMETIILPASCDLQYVSSSFVREIADLGGDVSEFVPPNVRLAFKKNRDSSNKGVC